MCLFPINILIRRGILVWSRLIVCRGLIMVDFLFYVVAFIEEKVNLLFIVEDVIQKDVMVAFCDAEENAL